MEATCCSSIDLLIENIFMASLLLTAVVAIFGCYKICFYSFQDAKTKSDFVLDAFYRRVNCLYFLIVCNYDKCSFSFLVPTIPEKTKMKAHYKHRMVNIDCAKKNIFPSCFVCFWFFLIISFGKNLERKKLRGPIKTAIQTESH